ncbi:MAG TPA: potassium-transporting ATPase subunit KdpC [Actinomycetota bacterium]|nr:potassium-transporting ATPase subunit KdpC [Actinomycetota bacterium]
MNIVRQCWAGLRLMLLFTVVLGLLYPLAAVALGRVIPNKADGSLVLVDGRPVGSSLIGQSFDGDGWFLPRPSAAGDGYDAMASGGTNLGPNNPALVDQIAERVEQVARREGIDPEQVPADALTASGSGLDPHISPEYARLQVPRVAAARGLTQEQVQALVDAATTPAGLGFLGRPHVNVLELNVAVQQAE